MGEDYAKMKAKPCNIVEKHRWAEGKTVENGAPQTKSEGQDIQGTFHTRQVHTVLQVEGGRAALRWHSYRVP